MQRKFKSSKQKRFSSLTESELKEPKFLRELHEIRKRISKIPGDEYMRQLVQIREKYRKELGDLYIED